MSEQVSHSQQSALSQRLRRLPGQLLLALVNATAVLVILAAILVLVAIGRAEDAAGRVTATVTEALAAHLLSTLLCGFHGIIMLMGKAPFLHSITSEPM